MDKNYNVINMIPDRDDFWLSCAPPSPQSVSAAAAASGDNQLLFWRADDNNSLSNSKHKTDSGQQTAWSRYLCYVEAMQSQGQKFDQKHVLEAMFRGNDLVYRSNASTDCTS